MNYLKTPWAIRRPYGEIAAERIKTIQSNLINTSNEISSNKQKDIRSIR